jgi:hypothetical protein
MARLYAYRPAAGPLTGASFIYSRSRTPLPDGDEVISDIDRNGKAVSHITHILVHIWTDRKGTILSIRQWVEFERRCVDVKTAGGVSETFEENRAHHTEACTTAHWRKTFTPTPTTTKTTKTTKTSSSSGLFFRYVSFRTLSLNMGRIKPSTCEGMNFASVPADCTLIALAAQCERYWWIERGRWPMLINSGCMICAFDAHRAIVRGACSVRQWKERVLAKPGQATTVSSRILGWKVRCRYTESREHMPDVIDREKPYPLTAESL